MLKIPRNARILSISHNDLDGVGCQIVLGHVYKNISYLNSSFYKLEENLQFINYDSYDFVFVTDIYPESGEDILNISDKIILIDHHKHGIHNPEKRRFVISDKGVCATVLTKKFLEKLYNIKLTELDEFVKYVNDYDMWHLKYKMSKFLNDLMFYKYRDEKFRIAFQDGRTTLTDEEKKFLLELHKRFLQTYEDIEVYPLEKINGCIVYEYDFVNEISDRIMKEYGYELVISKTPKVRGRVSFRSCNDEINLSDILHDMEYGGGHKDSAGMFVVSNNEFTEKMHKIENYIYENCKSMRIC